MDTESVEYDFDDRNIFTFFSNFMNQDDPIILLLLLTMTIVNFVAIKYYIQNMNCFTYDDWRKYLGGFLFTIYGLILGYIMIAYAANEINIEFDKPSEVTTISGASLYMFAFIIQVAIAGMIIIGLVNAPISLANMSRATFEIGHPRYKAISFASTLVLFLVFIRYFIKNLN